MIQEILVYIIIAAVILRIVYSSCKSFTTKEKSACGGCGSCDIKSELHKKGKAAYNNTSLYQKFPHKSDSLKYSPEH